MDEGSVEETDILAVYSVLSFKHLKHGGRIRRMPTKLFFFFKLFSVIIIGGGSSSTDNLRLLSG